MENLRTVLERFQRDDGSSRSLFRFVWPANIGLRGRWSATGLAPSRTIEEGFSDSDYRVPLPFDRRESRRADGVIGRKADRT